MQTDRFAAFLQEQIDRAARDEKTARDDYMQTPMDDTETAIDYECAKEHFATLAFIARQYQTIKGAQ